MKEEEICPHCEKVITDEDRESYWMKQAELTEKRLNSTEEH